MVLGGDSWIVMNDTSRMEISGFGGSAVVAVVPIAIGGEAYDVSGSYMSKFYGNCI